MSRIGKLPIKLAENVTVKVTGGLVEVTGPKGNLSLNLHPAAEVVVKDNQVVVSVKNEESKNIHGLTRSLIANMVHGVVEEWVKILELSGTGFRASATGDELQLALGFSHPVKVSAPSGIKFDVKENKISVTGIDKALVGEIAAKIRGLKPADPYKAKGFKYENEVIRRKAGKAAKTAA
jgi:large subunit ribosomal protein L6